MLSLECHNPSSEVEGILFPFSCWENENVQSLDNLSNATRELSTKFAFVQGSNNLFYVLGTIFYINI